MDRTYWQIAAGEYGRNYSYYFIKYGMAFVGGKDNESRMTKEVKNGDIVALKKGVSEIVAVGEVVEREGKSTGNGNKSWLNDFDGWKLPAYCYVDWHVPNEPIKFEGFTMGTIKQLGNGEKQIKLKEKINEILLLHPNGSFPEPEETSPVNDEQIKEYLIAKGLSTSSADDFTKILHRIQRLAKYYYLENIRIREHETRTFLVIPLLLALGWTEQQLKIELPCSNGRMDIACFSAPYNQKTEESVVLIVETKDFSLGLDYGYEQAHQYTKNFSSCRGILVTNGYCYKTYDRKKDGTFETITSNYLNLLQPTAYLNLLQLQDKYSLDPLKVGGALEVLGWLLPSNFR